MSVFQNQPVLPKFSNVMNLKPVVAKKNKQKQKLKQRRSQFPFLGVESKTESNDSIFLFSSENEQLKTFFLSFITFKFRTQISCLLCKKVKL